MTKQNIIIIDPAYIIRNEKDGEASRYGDNMEVLGIHTIAGAYVGEERRRVVDAATGKTIGEHLNDSGYVGIYPLEDVLAYNPDTDTQLGVIINGFSGSVAVERIHDGHKIFTSDTFIDAQEEDMPPIGIVRD